MFKKQYGLILNPKKKQAQLKPSAFGDSSDEEDSGKVGINKMLQREAVKKKDTKQVQKAMAEAMAQDPTVYEYDEVYDSIEDERKKAVASKLGMGKNKPKYISSLKKAAEQRQREYERVIERKAHKEREEEGEEFDDKEAFVTSSYRKKMEDLEADELRLKKEEEFNEKHGIHKQKDLNKFYSNLLKNNISMGAYNVKPGTSSIPSDNDSADTTTEQDKNEEDTKIETKCDDELGAAEQKNSLKRSRDEVYEERTDPEIIKQRSPEVQEVKPSIQDNNNDIREERKQEDTKKKHAEKRNTDEAVMAAKERYLARKRMRQETQ